MPVDPLSDTLSLIEARCVVSGGFTAGGDWGLRFWPRARLKIVAVVRGSSWISVEGEGDPVLLEAGDVAVVNGRRHVVLTSAPDVPDVDLTEMFEQSPTSVVRVSDGEETAVVGGHIEVNQSGDDLLLVALPPITRIRSGADEAGVIGWLLERLLHEMTDAPPGSSLAAHHHAQLLLIEVFRASLRGGMSFPVGWLRAFADEGLAPALRALHDDPARAWSLRDLCRLATMSRTTFVDRFRAAAGVPPMTYLSQWRMRLAERELRQGRESVASIARSLGYGSESAFSTAFKRTTGVSPRAMRQGAASARRGDAASRPSDDV